MAKAPWWGGMFEIMVCSTKRCLKKTVRSRKLTYASVEEESQYVVRRVRLLNSIVDQFWKRWSREYLIELRGNHKMKMKQKKLNIRKGDVVLIQEEGVRRNKWKLGKIVELITGSDGVTRGVALRTSKDGKVGQIQRPLQKLYPLEIEEDIEDDTEDDTEMEGQVNSKAACSGNSGTSGVSPGRGSDKTEEDIERLLSSKLLLNSKRAAATDGQIRRTIKEIKTTLKVLNFAGIKFRDFAIFSLNRENKYQGETFQVYNREIKYPRNLISGEF